jgi:phenol 2-monooxygenase (NADPH)
MSIEYGQSIVVAKDGPVVSKQELAPLLHVGKRFFSAQVVNVASATADQLTTRMLTNGAFRLLVFAGNIAEEKYMKRLRTLADYLDGPNSVVSKYTPSYRPRDSVVDVITIRKRFYHRSLPHY